MNERYFCEVYKLDPGRDFIIDRVIELIIEVIPDDENFVPDQNEVQYYGSDFGDPLVFQTVGYLNQPEFFIEKAIMWYAEELMDYPDMDLSKYPI